jgi:hypothetical protein
LSLTISSTQSMLGPLATSRANISNPTRAAGQLAHFGAFAAAGDGLESRAGEPGH